MKQITTSLVRSTNRFAGTHFVASHSKKRIDYTMLPNHDRIVSVSIINDDLEVRCHMSDKIDDYYDTIAYEFEDIADMYKFVEKLPVQPVSDYFHTG